MTTTTPIAPSLTPGMFHIPDKSTILAQKYADIVSKKLPTGRAPFDPVKNYLKLLLLGASIAGWDDRRIDAITDETSPDFRAAIVTLANCEHTALTASKFAHTSMNTAPTTPPDNLLGKLFDTINELQIDQACKKAKDKKVIGSAYSFDNKIFPITWNGTAYKSQYQDEKGKPQDVDAASVAELKQKLLQNSKKIAPQGPEKSLTIDMGNDFDENKFVELCDNMGTASDKVGYYKLGGKTYAVRYFITIPASKTPPKPLIPARYEAQYPHHAETSKHSESTPALLASYIANKKEVYDPHHDLDRESLLSKIREMKKNPFNFSNKSGGNYTLNGHTYALWSKKWLRGKRKYFAEVPRGEHGKETISALTVEGLYDKIVETVQGGHSHEKTSEKETNEKHESKEAHTDAAHPAAHPAGAHSASKGTLFDRSVEKVFGHGWIGKGLVGLKNLVPKSIRSLGGNTVGAGVTTGVVGGVVYGGSLALGSAALASAIVPIMGVTFTASMLNRFLKWRKWWPHNKEEGGGGSGGAHGTSHG